jgi:hypothetical protein
VKPSKANQNMVLAVGTTVVCVALLGIAIYSIIVGPAEWGRIVVYFAAIAFFASIALSFYMKWLKGA